MRFSDNQLQQIFARTTGYCHICHKKLVFEHYARRHRRGAWEVEHSRPQARGGTHHLNNLYPACIACNRAKGAGSTRTARARHGKTRAPLSAMQRRRAKIRNAILLTSCGAATGYWLDWQPAAFAALCGLVLGLLHNPDHR